MDRLKGKVALISGGARGQGAAEARLFVGEGAKVVIGDVLDDQCRKTADDINAKVSAKSVFPLHLDVTRAADWRAAVETCQREFGGLDILVNNAGIANVKGIEETSEEEWDSIVNINQKGVWLGMKYAVPALRKRGAGSIINISSIYGLIGSSGSAAYHGTKGAVRLLTKAAAIQYAPDKIRVNSIHPGAHPYPDARHRRAGRVAADHRCDSPQTRRPARGGRMVRTFSCQRRSFVRNRLRTCGGRWLHRAIDEGRAMAPTSTTVSPMTS